MYGAEKNTPVVTVLEQPELQSSSAFQSDVRIDQRKRPRNYKPLATTTPIFFSFIVAIIIAIVLLETVVHQAHPAASLQASASNKLVEHHTGFSIYANMITTTYLATDSSDGSPAMIFRRQDSSASDSNGQTAASNNQATASSNTPAATSVIDTGTSTGDAATSADVSSAATGVTDTGSATTKDSEASGSAATGVTDTGSATATGGEISGTNSAATATDTTNPSGSAASSDAHAAAASGTANVIASNSQSGSASASSGIPIPSVGTVTPIEGLSLSKQQLVIQGLFSKAQYFSALYSGSTLAIALKSIFAPVLASARMMEPFYQLAKAGGASAEQALISDYLAMGLVSDLRTVLEGHWVITLITVISYLFKIIASLASSSMTIRALDTCQTIHGPVFCHPVWTINLSIVRILEALLALTAMLIAFAIFMGWKRRSGITAYPASIASMAALLNNPQVKDDFRRLEPSADIDEVAKALTGQCYKCGVYLTPSGISRFGLIRTSDIVHSALREGADLLQNEIIKSIMDFLREIPLNAIQDILTLVAQVTYFFFLLSYLVGDGPGATHLAPNAAATGTLEFHTKIGLLIFKKQTVSKFFLTLATTLISGQWYRLEQDVRVKAPYRRLSKRNASSKQLIKMPLHGIPATTFPTAVYYGNYFHALEAFTALLSELLIVLVGGIPVNTAAQTQEASRSALLSRCSSSPS